MSDDHLRRLGAGLDHLDQGAIRAMLGHIHAGRPGKIADTLILHGQETRRLTHGHTLFELARRRSYAFSHALDLWDDDTDDLSDEYRDYLVDLAGVTSEDLARRVNDTLEDAHKAELDVNGSADKLGGVLKGFARGRLRTIVRTEGTRVAGRTRQDIADRAAEAGAGPSHMRWSAILDDRVTNTCGFAHNHYRKREDRDSRLLLPAHFNCRSLETYLFPEDLDTLPPGYVEWTPDEIGQFTDIRAQEFPTWV